MTFTQKDATEPVRKPRRYRLCVNCGMAPGHRPGKLCYRCSQVVMVKRRFPSKFANRGYGLGNETPPMPPEATTHLPGSVGKYRVLCWRAEHGFHLYHPDDAVDTLHDSVDSREIRKFLKENENGK